MTLKWPGYAWTFEFNDGALQNFCGLMGRTDLNVTWERTDRTVELLEAVK